ncbi:MAG: DUF4396 domain-containing protein, partial [Chloroflexota bacterium]|nr:DUF4396 domain-containing protein [Chloroflexota bacterium]
MEAAAHSQHHDHVPLPTSGAALNSVAFSATLHCLTGCAIGEVTGMVIGTALGFSDWGTIGLAVALAFLFGYTLTSLPLLRAGLALSVVVPVALATDTFSIAVMEIVDNGIMLAIPGAMHAGVGSLLFWGALSVALVVAGVIAYPVNRWLITKGRGHAVLHETGIHGGPPTRLVAFVAAAMAVFGTTVLIGEAVGSGNDEPDHGGEHQASGGGSGEEKMPAGEHEAGGKEPDVVRGLAVADNGLKLEVDQRELPRGRRAKLSFTVVDAQGDPVRDFEVEHTKKVHLIVARRDLSGFQHLHPKQDKDGRWSTNITINTAGSYRVFADFKRRGENNTLAADVAVDGPLDSRPLASVHNTADADGGYQVKLTGGASKAGQEAELGFEVTRNGEKVVVDDYLGAKGHLVALREGDMAYLHVHPADAGSGSIKFATEFPSDGRYGLFLQFKHEGKVRTATFTR